ncbi:efflux RND transporter permease subunit [Herbivorax sp. ANBcel31]|uniref:efflux RND transporter permease subunit n=1 Tax=Herbivorax sp. ANBcel31 TaxID=3069754 RepID=UPI0027B0C34C|nr:efflux RND transporter permease subunit [Herbivorax sp. ANBcel31]MDQ2085679.1 efflux RND transporter permease subunit [Herbivorax sp. ANBcel31]
MNISELSIKRPVTIIMVMLMIVVFGAVSFLNIPMDLLPNMNIPMAIIMTDYDGVGSEEVENFVTRPIESVVATVDNMKTVSSQSSEGTSIVMVEFNDGTDMDFAALDMRERIDMVRDALPDEVSNPMVIKLDPNMMPIAQIGVSSETRDEESLKNFVENNILNRLERIEGVASLTLSGGLTREIVVDMDRSKMENYGLTIDQVSSTLQMENINLPAGSVEHGGRNLNVRSKGEFNSISEIENIPLVLPQGNIIYIRDIASVHDEHADRSSINRMDGVNSMGLAIQKETTANTVEVVNLVKDELDNILNEYQDINIEIAFDQGVFVEEAVSGVARNGLIGAVLAMLILFMFLKSIRPTLIIAIAIPTSVISTFILIYISNTTLNMISMGGLALGVGMMVDNAIVVLESIHRHKKEGKSKFEAALVGAKEVSGAIIAATLTTVVVFIPIIFTEGMAAEIFKEMALAVTFSLLASLAVALTIVPMLSSKMLRISNRVENGEKLIYKIVNKWDGVINGIDNVYRKVLKGVLRLRLLTLVIAFIVFSLSMVSIYFAGVEFIPGTDQGLFSVSIDKGDGVVLEETDEVSKKVEKIIADIPEVEVMFTTVGGDSSDMMFSGGESHYASIDVTLVPLSQRSRSTNDIVEFVRKEVEGIPGADITVRDAGMDMAAMGGSPVELQIYGDNLDELSQISYEVVNIVEDVEGTREVESSVASGRPEAGVYVNRNRASQYGLSTMQVSSAISTSLQGQVATRYRVDGDEIDVRLKFPDEVTRTYQGLSNISVLSPSGINVPLGELVEIKMEEGPISISRRNQTRYVTVSSDLYDRDVGSVNSEIEERLETLNLPDGYYIQIGGENEQIVESFESLAKALMLSILLIYMVMAAQFESLSQPLIVMFSVPLAFSGAALGLFITGRTFNVASFIGVIMLSGIVVNNAILLIDYINKLRKRGMERNDAIIKAGPTRLRPILMTTLTTVLAMIPLSLGIGEGAEIQAPLATVVIFGLALATMLTLLVIPVIYTLFDDIRKKMEVRSKRLEVGS